jgi:hypothetical protein
VGAGRACSLVAPGDRVGPARRPQTASARPTKSRGTSARQARSPPPIRERGRSSPGRGVPNTKRRCNLTYGRAHVLMPELLLAPRREFSSRALVASRPQSARACIPAQSCFGVRRAADQLRPSRAPPQRECPARCTGVWKRTRRAARWLRRELASERPARAGRSMTCPIRPRNFCGCHPVRAVAGFSPLRIRLGGGHRWSVGRGAAGLMSRCVQA